MSPRNLIFSFNETERDRWVAEQARLLPHGSQVLDVGAGSCPYRDCFQHCRYQTQDFAKLDPSQLRGQLGYGEIDYVCDLTDIPVQDSSFDAVLCFEVLEHVPDPINALAEIARILKPGGKLLLTAPLGSGLHQIPYHFYGGFTPYFYYKFLGQLGFDSISVIPNGGFFKHYGQESQRLWTLMHPQKISKLWLRFLWTPVWLLALPVFRIFLPVACHFLDKTDRSKEFTVGYHVRAVRKCL
jgi:SAM-dependent methyltransferase